MKNKIKKMAAIRSIAFFTIITVISFMITACYTYHYGDGELIIDLSWEGDFAWIRNSDDSVAIVCYRGKTANAQIPSQIKNLPVTNIINFGSLERFDLYFYSRDIVGPSKKLTSVIIPDSVVSIGDGAFAFLGLTNVIIGNNVLTIGKSAFKGNRLTTVTIPDSVTSIGDSAFENNSLKSVNIPDTVILGNRVFAGNSQLVNAPMSRQEQEVVQRRAAYEEANRYDPANFILVPNRFRPADYTKVDLFTAVATYERLGAGGLDWRDFVSDVVFVSQDGTNITFRTEDNAISRRMKVTSRTGLTAGQKVRLYYTVYRIEDWQVIAIERL